MSGVIFSVVVEDAVESAAENAVHGEPVVMVVVPANIIAATPAVFIAVVPCKGPLVVAPAVEFAAAPAVLSAPDVVVLVGYAPAREEGATPASFFVAVVPVIENLLGGPLVAIVAPAIVVVAAPAVPGAPVVVVVVPANIFAAAPAAFIAVVPCKGVLVVDPALALVATPAVLQAPELFVSAVAVSGKEVEAPIVGATPAISRAVVVIGGHIRRFV